MIYSGLRGMAHLHEPCARGNHTGQTGYSTDLSVDNAYEIFLYASLLLSTSIRTKRHNLSCAYTLVTPNLYSLAQAR